MKIITLVKTFSVTAIEVLSNAKLDPGKHTANKNKNTSGAFLSQPEATGWWSLNANKRDMNINRRTAK